MILAEPDSQYSDMNAGAHRRPAPLVGCPGLVWHRCFWKPKSAHRAHKSEIKRAYHLESEPESKTTNRERLESDWILEIDAFLYYFYAILTQYESRESPLKCQNIHQDRMYLFRSSCSISELGQKSANISKPTLRRYGTTVIRHDIFSARIKIHGVKFTFRAALFEEFWSFTIFADFSDGNPREPVLQDAAEALKTVQELIINRYTEDNPDQVDDHQNIYHRFEQFRSKFCDEFIESGLSELGYNNGGTAPQFGHLFADSLGVILGIRPLECPDGFKAEVVPPTKGCPISEKVGDFAFEDTGALKMTGAVWPIVRRLHGGEYNKNERAEQRQGSPEYTVCRMQRSRAIFASALGRLRLLGDKFEVEPQIYSIIVTHSSRWQLGRLVGRLNELSALQLAALRDIEQLVSADRHLRQIQTDLAGGKSLSVIREALDQAEALVETGLAYRIEMSQAYTKRLWSLTKQLAIKRIEGFQRYDEFVERRVGDRFEKIALIGARYNDIKEAINLRADFDLNEAAIARVDRTNELLKTAEMIIIAPLAYYIGYVMYQIFSGPYAIFGAHSTVDERACFALSTILVFAGYIVRTFTRESVKK
ncbi:MAG: hypothetical protein ACOY45_04530 [Pseudomonadota bacterium]